MKKALIWVEHHSDETQILLGHLGFLEFLTATFIADDAALDIEPNEFLPQIIDGDS